MYVCVHVPKSCLYAWEIKKVLVFESKKSLQMRAPLVPQITRVISLLNINYPSVARASIIDEEWRFNFMTPSSLCKRVKRHTFANASPNVAAAKVTCASRIIFRVRGPTLTKVGFWSDITHFIASQEHAKLAREIERSAETDEEKRENYSSKRH